MTDEAQKRKETPIFSGVLAYFPDAIQAVARVSFKGNQKHNPGQDLHWTREKSNDHKDAALRHITDHAKGILLDPEDGEPHLAKLAWRALAALQIAIEEGVYKEEQNAS